MTPAGRRSGEEIDWRAVRARVARALAVTEEALRPSPDRARQIMDERARALARTPAAPRPASQVLEVATFALADERYAIETRYVREAIHFSDFTPVPGTPDFLVGLGNLRGDILSIFDLRKVFHLVPKGLTDLSRIIVLGQERADFGILADDVHEVRTIPVEDLLAPSGRLVGIGKDCLRGVTADALVVLDGAVLLGDERLLIDPSPKHVS